MRPGSDDETRFRWTSRNTKEHFLHILVFGTSPLRDEGDAFLEMPQVIPLRCGMKADIDFLLSSLKAFSCPFDDMIFKNTLMQLVQKVWCEA